MAHKANGAIKIPELTAELQKRLSGQPASAQGTQAGSFHKKCMSANRRATVLARQLLGSLIRKD